MTEIIGNKESAKVGNRRVHLANERTFLAWIRTSIGIMAFGFVVEKFTLFMKQMPIILGKSSIENTLPSTPDYSAFVGIFLVCFGTLMSLLAFIRYNKVERQIEEDTYQPSSLLDILLLMAVLAVGFFLVAYLIKNI